MEYLEGFILPLLLIIFFVYLINVFLLKEYYITVLDGMHVGIIVISIIVADVISMWMNDLCSLEESVVNLYLIYVYIILLHICGKKIKIASLVKKIREYMNKPPSKYDEVVFWCIFSLALFSRLFFSYSMAGSAMGDERISLAASNRVIDVIRNGTGLIDFFAIIFYKKTHSKKYLLVLFLLVVITAMSGSKGWMLNYATLYILYNFLTKEKRCNKCIEIIKYALFALLSLGGMIMVLSYFGNDMESAIKVIEFRILFPADAYLYAYVWGDYINLAEDYNTIAYLLHPFLKLIAEKGYDYPIGVALFGSKTGVYDGFGPNPILPILSLVLSQGNLAVATLIVIGVGSAILMTIVCANRLYIGSEMIDIWFKCVIYFSWTMAFLDFGMWEQTMIALGVFFVIVRIYTGILNMGRC